MYQFFDSLFVNFVLANAYRTFSRLYGGWVAIARNFFWIQENDENSKHLKYSKLEQVTWVYIGKIYQIAYYISQQIRKSFVILIFPSHSFIFQPFSSNYPAISLCVAFRFVTSTERECSSPICGPFDITSVCIQIFVCFILNSHWTLLFLSPFSLCICPPPFPLPLVVNTFPHMSNIKMFASHSDCVVWDSIDSFLHTHITNKFICFTYLLHESKKKINEKRHKPNRLYHKLPK